MYFLYIHPDQVGNLVQLEYFVTQPVYYNTLGWIVAHASDMLCSPKDFICQLRNNQIRTTY